MSVPQMSFSASVLILTVMVIRALGVHRLPKKTFLVLWGIVLCRLLIPFSLPSPFSVYTAITRLDGGTAQSNVQALFIPVTRTGSVAYASTLTIPAAPAAEHTLLTVIWIAGMTACALYFIITHLLCRKQYKSALPVTNRFIQTWLAEHPLRRPVQVLQSDRLSTPLTYGLWRPVVVLPKTLDWQDERQLLIILTHEFTHIKRFDILTKWLLAAASCVHWFNPLVWFMLILANRDIELSCDAAVVRTMGESLKASYASALISLEETKSIFMPLGSYFCKNSVEERVVSIMKIKKTSILGIALSVALVVCTTIAFATTAQNAESPSVPDTQKAITSPQQGEVFVTTDPNGEKQYSVDAGETWISEEAYLEAYPALDPIDLSKLEWWTYDEYSEWLEQEKVNLQALVGSGSRVCIDGENWIEFTQEMADETIRMYEQTLEDIRNGWRITKYIEGQDGVTFSMNFDPETSVGGSACFSGAYVVTDGETVVEDVSFGPYQTRAEYRAALEAYFAPKVESGEMTQEDIDKILSDMGAYGPDND